MRSPPLPSPSQLVLEKVQGREYSSVLQVTKNWMDGEGFEMTAFSWYELLVLPKLGRQSSAFLGDLSEFAGEIYWHSPTHIDGFLLGLAESLPDY
ncbi:hypothetical protein IQ258_20665 [Coleofasciculus sp. LEGE 07081]|nr:hypothetical protein [Coleofasciculus sp. LEGE 07081]